MRVRSHEGHAKRYIPYRHMTSSGTDRGRNHLWLVPAFLLTLISLIQLGDGYASSFDLQGIYVAAVFIVPWLVGYTQLVVTMPGGEYRYRVSGPDAGLEEFADHLAERQAGNHS